MRGPLSALRLWLLLDSGEHVRLIVPLFALCFVTSLNAQQPEWQIHASWCVGDPGSSGRNYRAACTSGADQFDSVMNCQSHNRSAQAAINAAGRTAVNAYMVSRAPSACQPVQSPCVRMGGAPAYLTNGCNVCRSVRLVGCFVGDVTIGPHLSMPVPRCGGTVQIALERGCSN